MLNYRRVYLNFRRCWTCRYPNCSSISSWLFTWMPTSRVTGMLLSVAVCLQFILQEIHPDNLSYLGDCDTTVRDDDPNSIDLFFLSHIITYSSSPQKKHKMFCFWSCTYPFFVHSNHEGLSPEIAEAPEELAGPPRLWGSLMDFRMRLGGWWDPYIRWQHMAMVGGPYGNRRGGEWITVLRWC